ncbi:MAG: hypothetical protein ACHQ1D_01355 [Nitrososphaerales archaeon]
MSNKVTYLKIPNYPTFKIRKLADEFWALGHKEISDLLHDVARKAENKK